MRYLTLILCVVMLVGCGTNRSEPDIQPTATVEESIIDSPEEATEEPTAIIFVRNTLPPTWTPVVEVEEETLVEATAPPSVVTQDRVMEGVRAEWTPVFVPTFSAECQNFAVVEPEDRMVTIGYQPVLEWSAIDGVGLYRLRVFNEANVDVYNLLLDENTHQIPETVLTEFGVYGWTVTPIDRLGFPMCGDFGDYFIVADI